MAFKIADGYVEVNGQINERQIKRQADIATGIMAEEFSMFGRNSGGLIGREAERNDRDLLRSARKIGLKAGEELGEETARAGSKSIGNGFSLLGSNPYVVAGVAAAGAVIAPMIGAAISGALIGASGLGVIGIGALLLKDEPHVKAAAGKLAKDATDIFQSAAKPLIGPFVDAIGIFRSRLREAQPLINEIFASVAPAIKPLADGISLLVVNALPGLRDMVAASAPLLTGIAKALPGLGKDLSSFFSIIAGGGPEATKFFTDFINFAGLTLISIGLLIRGLTEAYGAMRSSTIATGKALAVAWGGIVSAARSTGSALAHAWDVVSSVPGKVKSFFAGAGGWLVSAGRSIIHGLISGIEDALGDLRSELGKITNLIPDWKGPLDLDRKLLVPSGMALMRGLQTGIAAGAQPVRQQLGGLTAQMPAAITAPVRSPITTNNDNRVTHAPVINLTVNALAVENIPRDVLAKLDDALNRYAKSYA